MIEPVAEGAELGVRVLAEGEVLVRAGDGSLQVDQPRVDPGETRQLSRFASAHDNVGVCIAAVDDASQAAKPVAERASARQQRHARPVGDGRAGEADDRGELGERRPVLRVGLHCGRERRVAGRAATGLVRPIATEVGVVDDHAALQRHLGVGRRHDSHVLVMQQPRGVVAHAQFALERQRRRTRLGLADDEHGEEPSTKRQLRMLHTVPANSDVCRVQPLHTSTTRRPWGTWYGSRPAQWVHWNPPDQRWRISCSKHCSCVPNRSKNSGSDSLRWNWMR